MDLEKVCDLLQHFIGSYDINNPRVKPIAMAVRLKENNCLIGMCGFGVKEELGGDVEICYFIDEDYSGKGYMSQVVKAAIKYYFKTYNEKYVCALVDEQNTASRRILINNRFMLVQTNENPHYRLIHNPAWRAYKPQGQRKEKVIADEETIQKILSALESESIKYEVYFKIIIATGMRRGECTGIIWGGYKLERQLNPHKAKRSKS